MSTIPERQEIATAKYEDAASVVSAIANGGDTAEVPTLSGPTPTIKKWMKDRDVQLGSIVVNADRAEQAAEVAQTTAGIYADTATGLAATATGTLKYFYVPSVDNNEILALYRNNSGAAVDTGKRSPSQKLIESIRLTSGELFSEVSTFGQAFNGGVLVVGADGRNIGVKIPAGQTGNTSYVRAQLGLQDRIASLVGTKIQIDVYYDATLNFLTETVMTTLVMQVLRAGSAVTVTPDTQSLTQSGSVIHKTLTYTIQDGDSDVYPVFRPGISTTAAERSAVMSSVSWKLLSQPTGKVSWSDFHLASCLAPLSKKIAANTITSGERMDGNLYAWNGEALGGSVRVNDTSGNMVGLTIPNGASGGTAYLSPFVAIDGVALAGTTLRMSAKFKATANFTADCPSGNTVAQVKRGTASVNVAVTNLRVSQDGEVITKTFDYVINSADVAIAPTYQISGAAVPAAYDRSITIASIKFVLPDLTADALLGIQVNAATSKLGVRGPEKYVTVAETGGDFTTLAAVNAASASASLASPVLAIMMNPEGVLNVNLNDYFDVRGNGSGRVLLHHEAPADIDPVLIQTLQVLRPEKNNRLENIRATIKNGRYPIHRDSGNAFKNSKVVAYNCDFEHLGNQSAQDYQNSLPGGGVTVWPSLHAWGYGASSGETVVLENGRLKSPKSAYYMHTNLNFSAPSHNLVHGEVLVATDDTGKAVTIQPLGSGQADTVTLRGNSINGDVYYWCNPWLPSTLDYQPANHSEVKLFGYGNSPAVFEISEFGRALKIESLIDGDDSSVAVSGTAASVIFGKEAYQLDGCPGIPGYAYGWADISGGNVGSPTVGNITSLGKRLGNCTTVNKVLTVLIDGVTTKTVTFNLDYTNVSNVDILASINGVLAGSAVATAYNVGARYRPSFTDEELELVNATSEGIRMGMAVAYDNHHKRIRKMTAADDPSMFRGVAWEDIYPNTSGRVKTRGYLSRTDLFGLTAALMTFRQAVYIDPAMPGRMTLTPGINAIMRAVRTDAVEVTSK